MNSSLNDPLGGGGGWGGGSLMWMCLATQAANMLGHFIIFLKGDVVELLNKLHFRL